MQIPSLEAARALLDAQPFSVLLGARLERFGAEGVTPAVGFSTEDDGARELCATATGTVVAV